MQFPVISQYISIVDSLSDGSKRSQNSVMKTLISIITFWNWVHFQSQIFAPHLESFYSDRISVDDKGWSQLSQSTTVVVTPSTMVNFFEKIWCCKYQLEIKQCCFLQVSHSHVHFHIIVILLHYGNSEWPFGAITVSRNFQNYSDERNWDC